MMNKKGNEMSENKFDKRHGGAYDRGSADKYYSRPFKPHYYERATYESPLIDMKDMLSEELEAYKAGFDEETDKKNWD